MTDPSLGLPDARWRERALIFNTQPARYLHPSWHQRMTHGELLGRLRDARRARAALSRHLLTTFDLDGCYVDDFSSPWARLALLDGPWIERLMRRLGLALRAPEWRLELSGERLRRLKTALSEEDWQFLTRETPLLGRMPAVDVAPAQPDEEPATYFALIGMRFCVLQGLGALEAALTRRLALKLPAEWAPALNADPTPPRADTDALPPLLRKLLRDSPAWIPLFA